MHGIAYRVVVLLVAMAVGSLVMPMGPTPVAAAGENIASVTMDEVWARAAGQGHNSAVYMHIANDGPNDVALVGATADVADRVEIHETTMELTVVDGRVSEIMRMGEIERLVVPAGGVVKLEPGGLHIMLLGLTRNLDEGDVFQLTLDTEDGTSIVLDVPVTVGLGSDDHHHGDHHDHHEHHDH